MSPPGEQAASTWIGGLPHSWELMRLRHVANFVNGAAFKPDEWEAEGTPIIRIQNLNDGAEFNFTKRVLPSKYHVQCGDLLFGWSGNRGTSFGPFRWQHGGHYYLNQHIFRVYGYGCDRAWLYWVLKAVTHDVEEHAHGIIGMVHITRPELDSIQVPVPPKPVQQAIADFLDKKTAAIDTLIAKKERFIKLLQEKRQALITQAVTKGLDPNVPMKDSGIEWLGEIPAHWELKRLKHISPHQSVGVVVNPSTYVDPEGVVPFFYGADVSEFRLDAEGARRITETSNRVLAKSRLRAGDLVTVRVGEPGITAVVPREFDGSNCASVMFIRQARSFHSSWLAYAMNSRIGRFQVEQVQYGAAQKQFNIAHAVNWLFPVPPLPEQAALAVELDQLRSQLNSLCGAVASHIEKLREYRQALISAAVTGKIDVTKERAA